MWAFTVSHADRRMLVDDIRGSMAHVGMLEAVGLLEAGEAAELADGLACILAEAESGEFVFHDDTDEDVHTAVERRLTELIGPLGGKLHSGRSRNDQVVLDFRLYLSRAGAERVGQLRGLVGVLVDKAEQVSDVVVAAYTHLQQGQAIPLGHHLLAYAWMVRRDIERFEEALERIRVSPLGAGAAGGSSLPLDPAVVADAVGFPATFTNSLDAVGSRDFAAEYAFCCAQTMIHLSRLAEEMVLWATEEFGWVRYADRFTTGSSAMPQKKNPDIAEHVRGRAGRMIGDLAGLLALQKGLPLAYNSDLQEDKETVFRVDDTLARAVPALAGMLVTAEFDPPPPSSWVTALDLAEALVERGVPFREAHEAVGRLVASLVAAGRTLAEVTPDELEAAHVRLVPEDVDRLSAASSVAARRSPGGGSVSSVDDQVATLRVWLEVEP
jgi:argininosuccinate lyase